MRTYFRRRFADDALLATAYSLESILIELIFIAGPLLVAAFVAFASPAAAVGFAAFCGGAGALLFARSPALQGWRADAERATSLLGPIANGRFVAPVVLCYSTAFGLVEIGIAAHATEAGDAALARVLLGLMSAGSALGGRTYGSRSWHAPLAGQFAVMLAIMGSGLAFTWSTSALLGGVGAGLALGGGLLEILPAAAALACAAAAAFAAAIASRVTLGRGEG